MDAKDTLQAMWVVGVGGRGFKGMAWGTRRRRSGLPTRAARAVPAGLRRNRAPLVLPSLHCSVEFGTIMVWFFLCDRTDLLPSSDKVGGGPWRGPLPRMQGHTCPHAQLPTAAAQSRSRCHGPLYQRTPPLHLAARTPILLTFPLLHPPPPVPPPRSTTTATCSCSSSWCSQSSPLARAWSACARRCCSTGRRRRSGRAGCRCGVGCGSAAALSPLSEPTAPPRRAHREPRRRAATCSPHA